MAKTSKKRKQQRNNHPYKKKGRTETSPSVSSSASTSHYHTNPIANISNKADVPLPLPFPHAKDLPIPEKDFLRNVEPYKRTFRTAIETSYEGFTVDTPSREEKGMNQDCLFDHENIEQALLTMDRRGLFRTDVTQPFGLGTKCAKTYVTRCLLGEEGTTYKYLGLRMFAHPWDTMSKSSDDDDTVQLNESLNIISKLNKDLTERTKSHLTELEQTRSKRSFPASLSSQACVKGRAKYDVTLINRMTDAPDLKKEPTLGQGKCSVSWHADSTLEHYSSIAVYHTIMSDDVVADTNNVKSSSNKATAKKNKKSDVEMASKWSIALRCAHHSEGPGASRRGTNIESSVVVDTPPVAVSLPSRSAYYLLDDFNHHHQHAVIVNEDGTGTSKHKESASAGVRFASTHRLLREGHNVNFMLERCRVTCSQFHKKGPKIFRSEQLILTEIETEWIRQFYIQGEGHKKSLWKYWEEPICRLLKYWGQLEKRTKQVVDLLQNAAIARCDVTKKTPVGNESVPTRAERKKRDKQKKALSVVQDLLKRGADNGNRVDPYELLYLPMCEMVEERAKIRSLWSERENDRVFKMMESEYWPLPIPFQFNVTEEQKCQQEFGISPLGGTPDDLMKMSTDLKTYGKALMSQNTLHLPKKVMAPKSADETEAMNTLEHKQKSPESIECDKLGKNVKGKIGKNTRNEIVKTPSKDLQENSDEASKSDVIVRPLTKPSDHSKDLTWKGWGSIKVGLEMQRPWAQLLLDNVKTIETRAYDLPKSLIGKRIDILESKDGVDCVSGLSNVLVGGEIDKSVRRIGWAIFDRVIVYRYKAKFRADEKKHCVQPDSNYSWNDNTSVIYGWVVSKCGTYGKRNKKKHITCLLRRMRSLFEMQQAQAN